MELWMIVWIFVISISVLWNAIVIHLFVKSDIAKWNRAPVKKVAHFQYKPGDSFIFNTDQYLSDGERKRLTMLLKSEFVLPNVCVLDPGVELVGVVRKEKGDKRDDEKK